jgi:hypothetical protein
MQVEIIIDIIYIASLLGVVLIRTPLTSFHNIVVDDFALIILSSIRHHILCLLWQAFGALPTKAYA